MSNYGFTQNYRKLNYIVICHHDYEIKGCDEIQRKYKMIQFNK